MYLTYGFSQREKLALTNEEINHGSQNVLGGLT
jgi:hypothetical protein